MVTPAFGTEGDSPATEALAALAPVEERDTLPLTELDVVVGPDGAGAPPPPPPWHAAKESVMRRSNASRLNNLFFVIIVNPFLLSRIFYLLREKTA
jgi:hypothetical protein